MNRLANTLLASLAVLALSACEGALGGDLSDPHDSGQSAQSGEPSTTEVASRERTPRVRPPRPEPKIDDVTEESSDVTEGDPDPTPPTSEPDASTAAGSGSRSSGGRGGGRGGRGGARKGGGDATVEVVAAGEGAAGGGVIGGVVLFDGTPPARAPISALETTQGCEAHKGDPLTEDVIVNDGKLQNVFVTIKKLPKGVDAPAPPSDPYVLQQEGCLFLPHVGGIQAGTKVLASNDDKTSHNVRVSANRNDAPNKTVAAGGEPLELDFTYAETVKFACDIHPWMSAYVIVVEHPYFAVSGADGSFRIQGVPPGEYELEAWHERYKTIRSESFSVGANGEARVTFTYRQ